MQAAADRKNGARAMSETAYNVISPENGVPVKAWTKGVALEDAGAAGRGKA
jgi:hypothetical protein